MQTTDYTSKFDELIQKLLLLGENNDELLKWKQVFLAIPSEEQKRFLALLNNQVERLSKLNKRN